MNRGTALALFAFATLITLCVPFEARSEQAPAIVRVEVEPDTVTLGESARLRVTVLVPTWQPKPPVFPSFEVPNAITDLPPDSSYPVTERIGRDTWSGIVRNYQVTPLIAARFELGGQFIHITYADPGSAPITVETEVPTIYLLATVPPEAQGLKPFLAGETLELTRELDQSPTGLNVGDALVVRYQAVLTGMSVLFVPPLNHIDSDLVTSYTGEPELSDTQPAIRSESITLIANHGGEVTLPGLSLDWWNTSTGSIETTRIEPLVLTIAGPPRPTAVAEDDTPARSPLLWFSGALMLAAIALLAARWLPGYLHRRREAEAAKQKTEPYVFERLQQATRRSDAAVYEDTLSWLEVLDPHLSLREFAGRFGDETLAEDVQTIASHLYGGGTSEVDTSRLLKGLNSARARWMDEASRHRLDDLAPLNP